LLTYLGSSLLPYLLAAVAFGSCSLPYLLAAVAFGSFSLVTYESILSKALEKV